MHRLTLAATALLLTACAQDATLPPIDTSDLPPSQEAPDWEDWGEDRKDVPPGGRIDRSDVIGTLLDDSGIRRAVSGATLDGCYPNGEGFAERLDRDGDFFDAKTGEQLGQWYVDSETLCFRYPNREQDACFAVSLGGGGELHFYQRDFTAYVASTRCPMRLGE